MSSKLVYHISPHEVVTLEEPDVQILMNIAGNRTRIYRV
jgi:hypothetical protein